METIIALVGTTIDAVDTEGPVLPELDQSKEMCHRRHRGTKRRRCRGIQGHHFHQGTTMLEEVEKSFEGGIIIFISGGSLLIEN